MNTNEILSAIDAEISKLQQARSILSGYSVPMALRRGPGRPKKTATAPQKAATAPQVKVVKRGMSAEGKARIAAAQKKRWAAAKKLAKTAA
ncbi:hypothetical protein [Terriglobus roseus]|uniref:Uncharacterized protein n=1 Tax=Terriglobus roseus TaxID=392734 RepID=A0A1H4JXL2_9BACT|nr:hypothetical protein [Terriglobus roseus]SEB50598.1 hypothetical protein SAMN05443244_0860 [Terriglobus roseus]